MRNQRPTRQLMQHLRPFPAHAPAPARPEHPRREFILVLCFHRPCIYRKCRNTATGGFMGSGLIGIIGLCIGFGIGWALFYSRLVRAEAKAEALEQGIRHQEQTEAKLKAIFENTANALFENATAKFTTH